MECPCTDKWVKKLSEFSTLETGTCGATSVVNPEDCFTAASELGLSPVTTNLTVSSEAYPPHCSVTAVSGGFEIVFNNLTTSSVKCGDANSSNPRVTALAESLTTITIDLKPDPVAAAPSIVGYFMSTGVATNNEQLASHKPEEPDDRLLMVCRVVRRYDVRITEFPSGNYTAECLCVSANCKKWPTATGHVTNGVLSMFSGIPGSVSVDNNVITFTNGKNRS